MHFILFIHLTHFFPLYSVILPLYQLLRLLGNSFIFYSLSLFVAPLSWEAEVKGRNVAYSVTWVLEFNSQGCSTFLHCLGMEI